jgi:hypothetical protein
MVGYYQTVSIENVIDLAKQKLGLMNTTDWDDRIETEIKRALKKLNCTSMLQKKQVCLDVCDGAIKLPCDLYEFVGMRFVGEDGRCHRAIYNNADFLKQCGCSPYDNGGNASFLLQNFFQTYQIQNGYIIFPDDVVFEKATIAYMAYITDKEGNIQILDIYEEGLAWYAVYQFQYSVKTAVSQNYTEVQRAEAWGHWLAAKRWLKGDAAVREWDLYKREVGDLWNGLIVDTVINNYK